MTFERDNHLSIAASDSLQIRKAGAHIFTISTAINVAANAIQFTGHTSKNEQVNIRIYHLNNDGTKNNIGINKIQDLMSHLNYDRVEASADGHYKAFENIEIGALCDISINRGFVNLQLISWFDAHTLQTPWEKEKGIEASFVKNKLLVMDLNHESA